MPATMVAAYDAALSRITLTIAGLDPATASSILLRWEDGETPTIPHATYVRGGDVGAVTSAVIHDYEFAPGVTNRYQLYTRDALGVSLGSIGATPTYTTPPADGVWLKSIARPFLNRQVTVIDFGAVSSPARGGVIEVAGRRLPVAVTEVRGSRNYELVLRAADRAEADALELFLSFGDVVFVQVPADCTVPRSLYAHVGNTSAVRAGAHDSEVRYFSLPLTEVDAPDPSIVGYTITYGGVQAAWATYGDILADAAVPTYLALLQYVSSPSDEIVG